MKPIFTIAALVLISSLDAVAQLSDPDPGEASVYTGVAFGGTGTNVAIGGAIGTVIDRYVIVMLDAAYIPMGRRTLVFYPGAVVHSSGLYDFNLAAHIRVPLRSKWEPYGILGPALLYNHYRKAGTLPNGAGYYFGASDVRGGFETGGGARYYWKAEEWGLKGEYRYTISSHNFSSILVGVFRQF
jgi:hypothetical protein